jgi:hypothetical protein
LRNGTQMSDRRRPGVTNVSLPKTPFYAGFKDPDQLRSDPMLEGPVAVGLSDLPSEKPDENELRISLA